MKQLWLISAINCISLYIKKQLHEVFVKKDKLCATILDDVSSNSKIIEDVMIGCSPLGHMKSSESLAASCNAPDTDINILKMDINIP